MFSAELQALLGVSDPTDWCRDCGIVRCEPAVEAIGSIARRTSNREHIRHLAHALKKLLPRTSDPDRVLINLDRFVDAANDPAAILALFANTTDALIILLQLFSASQYLSETLVRDPSAFDLARLTDGRPVARETLIDELWNDVASVSESAEDEQLKRLRQFKQRELLRIAYGDVVRGQTIEMVTQQLSYLADSQCEVALRIVQQSLQERFGAPRNADGEAVTMVVLALGKLGGVELNYSSDIDLIVIYSEEGRTDGARRLDNRVFFERFTQIYLKLLSGPSPYGSGYRVDLRLRPLGETGPAAMSVAAAEHYYDVMGRTWERQAYVKARPVAGDLQLGNNFLMRLTPWVYQRYLTLADINGICALKRRIESQAASEDCERRNVKTGYGGIRDIEFVIQFLQLLNGGDLPELRTGNTLEAILRLEQSGCLTMQERTLLEEHYRFLRQVEHRLQVMFDLQDHLIPARRDEIQRLAVRLGYQGTADLDVATQFLRDFRERTDINRKILDHLLHDPFADGIDAEPEVDLVLDPNPSRDQIVERLSRFRVNDVSAAYDNLMAMSRESIPFLSTRRCRQFFSSIAPCVLDAVSRTPDPDTTLAELARVSDSLGGKTILWELFSSHLPSLQLTVRLCACSPYLTGILTSQPGMIDELLDSLLLDRLPSLDALSQSLDDLCRNAEDLDPILHSFKAAQHLRVGVRDIEGRDDIVDTTRALSDIAEVCLRQIVEREYARITKKYGVPRSEMDGRVSELVVLALGKLGGQEPNYHSDLDLMFVYTDDGRTCHTSGRSGSTTSNQHFFSELGQRIIQAATRLGPRGKLYDIDMRLRPAGASGALAVCLDTLRQYFRDGSGQLWERQALCRARPIYGNDEACLKVEGVVRECIFATSWQPENANEIRSMRQRMEQGANRFNLKRGAGGTVDVEFLVQMLQLRYGLDFPSLVVPGTMTALHEAAVVGVLPESDVTVLREGYRFLRGVEARLRLMNTTARHDLPSDSAAREKLAYLLRMPGPDTLMERCREVQHDHRALFNRYLAAASESIDS